MLLSPLRAPDDWEEGKSEREREERLRALQEELSAIKRADAAAKAHEAELARRVQAAADADARRRLEEERLRLVAKAIAEANRARELAEQRRRELEARRLEEAAQQKLREIGVCPVGYRWIKQGGGYRCAGGSHYVTNAQLGM